MNVTEAPPKKRRFKKIQAAIGLLLIGVVVGLAAYLTSDTFRDRVRARVVAELERMTGGKVEIESFTWNLSQLQFEARGLTIHGLEGPGEEPYVHAAHISLKLKILSLISRQVALREVVIDHVSIHLIINPDGSTNQPRPGGATAGEELSPQRLVDLAIAHVQINDGTLLLNREKLPFALAGGEFAASITYSRADQGYDGIVSASLASAQWRDLKLAPGKINLHVLLRATESKIRSLEVSTGTSTLQASGSVRNYNHPALQMQYTASLDLPFVAQLTSTPELRGGRADIKGVLSYQDGHYSTEGAGEVHGVEWRDVSWRVSGVDGNSQFIVTPNEISLPRFSARAFGGNLQGDLHIPSWNRAAGAKQLPAKSTANVQLSRLQIGQLAAAVSTARMPLHKVDLVGAASGEVKATWTGSAKNAVAAITADVEPPATPSPHQVPVTAHLRSTYYGDIRTLEIATLSLGSRSIHMNASGEIGTRNAQAHIAVSAGNLHELQPALDALRPGARIPVVVDGRALFNGVVFGKLEELSARGHLDLENFSTEIAFAPQREAADAGSPSQKDRPVPSWIHWDSLTADVSYTPSMMSLQKGQLRRGKTQVGFSASAGLHHGAFDEYSSQVAFDLRMENAAVEDLQMLAGLHYPITGVLGADLHASGTAYNLAGSGSVQIAKPTAWGEPFRTFRSQIQIAGREVQLRNIFLGHNGALVTGSATYDMGSKNYRFDLTGTSVDLATLRKWAPERFTFSGKATFHVIGAGGMGTPVLNGKLDVPNLVINRETVGAVTVTAETHGPELKLHGQSIFEQANLTLDGDVHMAGDFPAVLTLRFKNVDFDPLLRAYLGEQVTGHSSVAGEAELRGPIRRPRDLAITGNITQFSANVENIKLENNGPIHMTVEHGMLRVDQFHLTGTDTELFLRGGFQLTGDHALDIHGRGQMDLKLAQGLNPNIVANGPATFTVDAVGTKARPLMNGRIELKDANVSLVDLPNGLSHINGTMVLAQDRLQIEKLTAHSGGGELNLGGFLAYRSGLYFDLTATGKDVRLRYPPGVSAAADATLRYTGSAKSSLLSGDITVTRFGMNPHFDFGVFLAETKNPSGLTSLNPFLDNLRLDVHITSTPELRVETTLAKVSGDLDLRVRGTAARPAVLGRVNIAEGDVYFNGTKYRLERGDVTFSNPLLIEPAVNVELSARVQNYDVTVGLHGTMAAGKGLRMTYRSDPPLSNSDIIALLAFGQPRGRDVYNAATPGQSTTDSATASNAILGQALDAALSQRVERLFGGSRVRIDPQFIGQQSGNPSARVTVEQTINNNITLTYITNLAQSQQTVIQVEYNVDKNISLVAVRDQYGIVGFDVHIRRRKK